MVEILRRSSPDRLRMTMPAWRVNWRARGLERTGPKTRQKRKVRNGYVGRTVQNELDIECIVVST